MAIKVVWQGTPKPVQYKGKCEGCSSVMECGEGDLIARDKDADGPRGTAVCPVCSPGTMRTVFFRPTADYDRLKKAGEK